MATSSTFVFGSPRYSESQHQHPSSRTTPVSSRAGNRGNWSSIPQPIYSNGSRKRPRTSRSSLGYGHSYTDGHEGTWSDIEDSKASLGTASPAPLVASTYGLASGMDTPTRNTAAQYEAMELTSESDFRRRWTSSTQDEGRQTVMVGALDRRQSNGRKRARSSPVAQQEPSTWGQFVYDMVGGAASTLYNFCKSGHFTGFRAGGGQKYGVNTQEDSESQKPYSSSGRQTSLGLGPVPGQYPSDILNESVPQNDDLARSAKRQQITPGNDWVVVEPSSQKRPHSSSSNYLHSASPHRPASRVSLRAMQPRRTKAHGGRLTSVSYAGSPQLHDPSRRAASYVNAGSPDASLNPQEITPPRAVLEADLQRYSAKKQRETKQSDASMKRLNSQLQAMIKQGQQALASTVEIQDDSESDEDDMWDGHGAAIENRAI